MKYSDLIEQEPDLAVSASRLYTPKGELRCNSMNIKDLRDGMRRVDADGEIADISPPREVTLRTGDQARVADATLKDDSGTIKLSLWDDQIDAVTKGAHVKDNQRLHQHVQGRKATERRTLRQARDHLSRTPHVLSGAPAESPFFRILDFLSPQSLSEPFSTREQPFSKGLEG